MVLIIWFICWRGLTGRDDPLDSYALSRKQLGDDLLVGPSGKVIEKIDHGRTLRVLVRILSNRHRRRSTRMSGRRGTVSTLPRPSCPAGGMPLPIRMSVHRAIAG